MVVFIRWLHASRHCFLMPCLPMVFYIMSYLFLFTKSPSSYLFTEVLFLSYLDQRASRTVLRCDVSMLIFISGTTLFFHCMLVTMIIHQLHVANSGMVFYYRHGSKICWTELVLWRGQNT